MPEGNDDSPKLPGPETREKAAKAAAAEFDLAHEAFAATAAAHQKTLEALAPALNEKLGIDVKALTEGYGDAFEQVAAAIKK